MTTNTKRRTGGAKGANGYGEYKVRYASERQTYFIKKLLAQKKHNYGELDLTTLNVQGAGDVINELLKCPDKEGYVEAPTEKQLSFAQSLITNKEGGTELLNKLLSSHNATSLDQLSKQVVSGIINTLKLAKEVPLSITEVGAYLKDATIYSIRKSKESTVFQVWSYNKDMNKYLREPNNNKEKELLKTLQPTDRLTLELAIRYSAQTGICVHCGRTLTLLKSVAGGMGAVCAKRYR